MPHAHLPYINRIKEHLAGLTTYKKLNYDLTQAIRLTIRLLWQCPRTISQNQKSSVPTEAFMYLTCVSYLTLLLTEAFKYSTFL